jgi:hypothetical protein
VSYSLAPLYVGWRGTIGRAQYVYDTLSMAQKWPSTEREFIRRFPVPESSSLHNLPQELKSASGSALSAKHLQAFRVLVQDYSDYIPILNDYKATATTRVAADRSLLTSLTAISYEELRSLSHRALSSPVSSIYPFYFPWRVVSDR